MPDTASLHLVSQRPLACEQCRLRAQCLPDHLDDDFAQAAARVIRPHQPIARGTYLFRQGAPVNAFYFLRSGSAKSVVSDSSGRESIMRFLFPSDLVGSASMDLTTYHDSIITLERSSFCELRSADLLRMFHDDPPAL
jgi:CRP/FNR family transcriptional regulator, anaerobic regulatory protein